MTWPRAILIAGLLTGLPSRADEIAAENTSESAQPAKPMLRAIPIELDVSALSDDNVISDSRSTENCRVPRSDPSIRGKTSFAARTNRILAEASNHSYYVNDFFFDRRRKECLQQIIEANRKRYSQKTALYFVDGFLSSKCQEQIQFFAPAGYRLKAVFCEADGKKKSKQVLGSGDRCGLFITFYEHQKGGRVLSVKGSSSTLDWTNNFLNRGAKYIEAAVQSFFRDGRDVGRVGESAEDGHALEIEESNDPSRFMRNFVSKVDSEGKTSRRPSEKLLMTGHSLGGALAHNLAAGIKLKWPESRNIHLVTFNALSAEAQGQSLSKRFLKKSDEFFADVHSLLADLAKLPSKQASTAMKIPPGISGLNIATFDDVLQPVNSGILRTPLSVMPLEMHVLLSNRLSVSGDSRLLSVKGHRMSSVLKDLCWSQHESFYKTFVDRWDFFDSKVAIEDSRRRYNLYRVNDQSYRVNADLGTDPDTNTQGLKEERLRQLPSLADHLQLHYGPTGRSTLAIGYRCQDRAWDCSMIKHWD